MASTFRDFPAAWSKAMTVRMEGPIAPRPVGEVPPAGVGTDDR